MDLGPIIKLLRELMRQLKRDPTITEIEVSQGDLKCRVSRGRPSNPEQLPLPSPSRADSVTAETDRPSVAEAEPAIKTYEVKSPMVGTFYRAPSPDAEPYVKVGDQVESGRTLCIVEAMKLMNEIESEVTGKIIEICVQNTQPVEYGQVLFRIQLPDQDDSQS